MQSRIIPAVMRATREAGLTITSKHLESIYAEGMADAIQIMEMSVQLALSEETETSPELVPGLNTALGLLDMAKSNPVARLAISNMMSGKVD